MNDVGDEYSGLSMGDIGLAIAYSDPGSEDQERAIAALVRRAPPAGIGHNQPPLEEQITEDLEPRLARAKLLIGTADTSVIRDDDDEVSAGKVVDLVRQLKELHDELDVERLAKTKPHRDAHKLINDTYGALQLRLTTVIGGTSGNDGLNGMLTRHENKKRALAEAERQRLEAEARARQEEADRLRREADAKAEEGKVAVTEELDAIAAEDAAAAAQHRAEVIRPTPTRSQLGQTTRRKAIHFEITDWPRRITAMLKSPSRNKLEEQVQLLTDQELRGIGVAAVEKAAKEERILLIGVKAWVDEGGVRVRR